MIWRRIVRSRAAAVPALAVGACLIVAALSETRFFRIVELNGFDRLVELIDFLGRPRPAPRETVFVDISDATVKALERWPIPRDKVAEAIDRIAAGGPELIGLDMILAEPRTPPEDEALVAALARAGNVIVAEHRTESGIWEEPRPEFRAVALDVGAVSFFPDADGAVRRVPLALRVREAGGKERGLLGFAAALYTNYRQTPLSPVRRGLVRFGDREIEVDDKSGVAPSILIDEWRGADRRVDLLDVLRPELDPAAFHKKIVIIGESSQPAKDRFETPLYRGKGLVSGPEIHAAALAVLLDGAGVRVLPRRTIVAVNLLVAFLAVIVVMYDRPAWAVVGVITLGVGAIGVAWGLLAARHIWLSFVSTEMTLVLCVSAALGYRFLLGDEQERKLRELFGRYVSSDVLREVLRHPEGVVVEGQERTATILFADIRGFTSTSAGQPPREVIAWVNGYFAAMSEVIERHGGFLNKFIGDGLMVVFGAPVSEGPRPDAERAVRAGLQMLERLHDLNRENAARAAEGLWRPPIGIGIGIHTGSIAAGSVGAPRRMEYSVMGETVNLAARLESATRQFEGVDLVISSATHELVRDGFVTEPLGTAAAKGFSEDVQVYTVRAEKKS